MIKMVLWILALTCATNIKSPTTNYIAESKASACKYGIKMGYVVNTIALKEFAYKDKKVDWDRTVGDTYGFYMRVPLGKRWFLEPEVLYVRKGIKANVAGTELFNSNDFDAIPGFELDRLKLKCQLTLDYVEIPILIKVRLKSPEHKIVPSVFAGPTFSYLVHSKIDVADTVTYNTRGLLKKIDLGIAFGVDVDVKDFSLDVCFDMGLKNISNVKSMNENLFGKEVKVSNAKFTNMAILITIGYGFN